MTVMHSLKVKIPEAMGVVTGGVFLIATFLLIPLYAYNLEQEDTKHMPHSDLAHLLAALLSVSCTLLLGFVDDVLDLKYVGLL